MAGLGVSLSSALAGAEVEVGASASGMARRLLPCNTWVSPMKVVRRCVLHVLYSWQAGTPGVVGPGVQKVQGAWCRQGRQHLTKVGPGPAIQHDGAAAWTGACPYLLFPDTLRL